MSEKKEPVMVLVGPGDRALMVMRALEKRQAELAADSGIMAMIASDRSAFNMPYPHVADTSLTDEAQRKLMERMLMPTERRTIDTESVSDLLRNVVEEPPVIEFPVDPGPRNRQERREAKRRRR